jgi:uncharacterized membrane protein YdjX (TVP38/TMEM64 family)
MYRPPVWLRVALLAFVFAGIIAAVTLEIRSDARHISDFIAAAGPLVPLVYVVLHVLASLFFVPRSVMALVAGILFSFWSAVLWATIGSMAGAVVGFLLARYVNAGLIVPEEMKRIGPALQRAEAGGWRAVAIIRLLPLLPHALTNYALGLTRLGLGEYSFGSLVGILPEAYVFVQLGLSGRRALDGGGWIEPMLWGLAFIVLSVVVPRLFRRWQP